MIITSKDLFEAYTKTEQKGGFVHKKAKELNITRSQVIAELLKSGYKLEELKRSDENNYNAGVNKYKKWIESGSPEQTYEVPEVAPIVKEKKKYEKPVLKEITSEEEKIKPEETAAETEPEPVSVSEPEPVAEEPKSADVPAVKPDVPAVKKEKKSEDEFDNAKLRLRIIDLENEIEQLKKKNKDMWDCTEKYNKLLGEYNLVSADFETVQNTMAAEYQKRLAAEAKLRKAERIICDRIYEEMPDNAD